MKKRILVEISSHGFGHVAQTASVLNPLCERLALDVTLRTRARREILESRFDFPFERIEDSVDFGIVMKNAVDVDVAATARRYAEFHENWAERVRKEAAWMREASFDLVLSNVPYLPLKAASVAGIASVAFCSLNWADLYRHYCMNYPGSEGVFGQILDAYRSANAFLRVEPSMPMPDLDRAFGIGPVSSIGRKRRDEIAGLLGLKKGERLGIVSMGGMPFSVPFRCWPAIEGMHWLVPEEARRADMTAFDGLAMPFRDLLASCDVLLTKPGYGSFVEAAMCGVAVLYLEREDWPEEPFLVEWLKEKGRCGKVRRDALESGKLREALDAVFSLPEKPLPSPTGITDAIGFLEKLLRAT